MVVPYSSTTNFEGTTGVAVGNLDSDKELELATIVSGKGLVVFEHDGKLKWSVGSGSLAKSPRALPALADMDGDGAAEVIVGGVVVSNTGKILLDKGLLAKNSSWYISTVAALDEDGKLELVGGNVSGGKVYVLSGKDGKIIFGPVSLPGGGVGGASATRTTTRPESPTSSATSSDELDHQPSRPEQGQKLIGVRSAGWRGRVG